MAVAPQPLEVGTEIAGRFEIVRVLGSGGFGITYEAFDRQTDQNCVVKELAPTGAVRQENGDIHFTLIGPEAIQRCRRQFESESRLLRSLKLKGVIPAYAECIAHGTVYMAMKLIPGAITLQELFNRTGALEPAAVEEILRQVLTTLGQLHVRGILHRDIKPSNLLIDPEGDVNLIDFGSAREWVADITQYQTVEFTPGYAPIEQLSEAARRGPGTDLYSLAATVWYLFVGTSPISATDRASGIHAPSLESLRTDCPKNLARAIQQALELRLNDRPSSAQEMLNLLDGINDDPTEETDWSVLDNTLNEIQNLKFGKLECPCCSDVLISPKALKSGTCIVCRSSPIKNRNLEERRCAACKIGVLRPTKNDAPLHFCPACKVGVLEVRSSKPLQRRKSFQCSDCKANYVSTPAGVMLGSGEGPFTWDELREVSGRGALVFICDHCQANFDEQSDGRWTHFPTNGPELAYRSLYPSEWARVAANLDPGAGNAYCPTCASDYFVEGDSICLLNVHEDPYKVGDVALDVVMSRERATWVGAGKSSGRMGLSCSGCAIELDPIPEDQYELGRPPTLDTLKARRMKSTSVITASMADWHRIARGLPRADQDEFLNESIYAALISTYTSGELKLDMIWDGSVEFEDKVVPMKVSEQGITVGKWLGKSRLTWDDIEDITAEDKTLQLDLEQDSMTMLVHPMELLIHGKAQTYRISIGASELAERIQNTLLS